MFVCAFILYLDSVYYKCNTWCGKQIYETNETLPTYIRSFTVGSDINEAINIHICATNRILKVELHFALTFAKILPRYTGTKTDYA